MNLLLSIRDIWFKLMADQLRKPSGLLAKITGNKMNKANELLYQLTLDNMHIKDGDHILEIGFGNGGFFHRLNTKGNDLQIFGIEHSPEMDAASKKMNHDLYKSGKLKTQVGNSNNLPFENNSFDKIFCVNVIYFWEDPISHLKEIQRVLKPGGYFCTSIRPKENLSKFPFAKHGFTLYSEEEWKRLLLQNDFEFISSYKGGDLEFQKDKKNLPFESLCIVCLKGI